MRDLIEIAHKAGSSQSIRRTTAQLAADGELVAAVTGKKIRVLAVMLTASAANVTVFFRSNGVAGTIIGQAAVALGVPVPYSFNPFGWFETAAGENLYADVTTTGGALTVDLVYVEVG